MSEIVTGHISKETVNIVNNADKILKPKTKFDYVFPKFDILDIIEGVVAHRLVPERLNVSDLMTRNYQQIKIYKNLS